MNKYQFFSFPKLLFNILPLYGPIYFMVYVISLIMSIVYSEFGLRE